VYVQTVVYSEYFPSNTVVDIGGNGVFTQVSNAPTTIIITSVLTTTASDSSTATANAVESASSASVTSSVSAGSDNSAASTTGSGEAVPDSSRVASSTGDYLSSVGGRTNSASATTSPVTLTTTTPVGSSSFSSTDGGVTAGIFTPTSAVSMSSSTGAGAPGATSGSTSGSSASVNATFTATSFYLQRSALPTATGIRRREIDDDAFEYIYLGNLPIPQYLNASTASFLNLCPQAFALDGQSLVTADRSQRLMCNKFSSPSSFLWEFHPNVSYAEASFIADAPAYADLTNESFYAEPQCTSPDGRLLLCEVFGVSQMQFIPSYGGAMFIGLPGYLDRQSQEVLIVYEETLVATNASSCAGLPSTTAISSASDSTTDFSPPLPTSGAPNPFWLYWATLNGTYFGELEDDTFSSFVLSGIEQQDAQQFILSNNHLVTAGSNLILMAQTDIYGSQGLGYRMVFASSTQAANSADPNPETSDYEEVVCSLADTLLTCNFGNYSNFVAAWPPTAINSVFIGPLPQSEAATVASLLIEYAPTPVNSSAVSTTLSTPLADPEFTETTGPSTDSTEISGPPTGPTETTGLSTDPTENTGPSTDPTETTGTSTDPTGTTAPSTYASATMSSDTIGETAHPTADPDSIGGTTRSASGLSSSMSDMLFSSSATLSNEGGGSSLVSATPGRSILASSSADDSTSSSSVDGGASTNIRPSGPASGIASQTMDPGSVIGTGTSASGSSSGSSGAMPASPSLTNASGGSTLSGAVYSATGSSSIDSGSPGATFGSSTPSSIASTASGPSNVDLSSPGPTSSSPSQTGIISLPILSGTDSTAMGSSIIDSSNPGATSSSPSLAGVVGGPTLSDAVSSTTGSSNVDSSSSGVSSDATATTNNAGVSLSSLDSSNTSAASTSDTATSTASTFVLQRSALPATGGVRRRASDDTLEYIYLGGLPTPQYLPTAQAVTQNLLPQTFSFDGQSLVTSNFSLRLMANNMIAGSYQWEFHPNVSFAKAAFIAAAPAGQSQTLDQSLVYAEPNCTSPNGRLLICEVFGVSQMQFKPLLPGSIFIGSPGLPGVQAQEISIVQPEELILNTTSAGTISGGANTAGSMTGTVSSLTSVTTPIIPLPTPEAPGAFWLYARDYSGGYYVKVEGGTAPLVLTRSQQSATQFVIGARDTVLEGAVLITASSDQTLVVEIGGDYMGPGSFLEFWPSIQYANYLGSRYIEALCSVSGNLQLNCTPALSSGNLPSGFMVSNGSADGAPVLLGSPSSSQNTVAVELYLIYVPTPLNSGIATTSLFASPPVTDSTVTTVTPPATSSISGSDISLPTSDAFYLASTQGDYYIALAPSRDGSAQAFLTGRKESAQPFVLPNPYQVSSLVTADTNLSFMVNQPSIDQTASSVYLLEFWPSTQDADIATYGSPSSAYSAANCTGSGSSFLVCVAGQYPWPTKYQFLVNSTSYTSSSGNYTLYMGDLGTAGFSQVLLQLEYVSTPTNNSAVSTTSLSSASDANTNNAATDLQTITTVTSTQYNVLYAPVYQTLSGGTVLTMSSPTATETNTVTRTYTITTATSTVVDVAYSTGSTTLSGGTIITTFSPTATAFRTTTQTLYLTPVTMTTTIFYYTTSIQSSNGTAVATSTFVDSADVQIVVQTSTTTTQ
jgi:hypothetical protein